MNSSVAHPRPRLARLFAAALACLTLAGPALAAPGAGSPDGVWRELAPDAIQSGSLNYDFDSADDYRMFHLDDLALFRVLREAPLESRTVAAASDVILALPMPDGTFARFRVSESPVLSPELHAQYPELRSYVAQGLDDPTHTARFTRSPFGFAGIIVTPGDLILIERERSLDDGAYLSFHRADLPPPDGMTCSTDEFTGIRLENDVAGAMLAPPSGANLRTYNLALVATAEFRNTMGSALATTNQFNNYITQVNALYEAELAIRFTITCSSVNYTNTATDPFTNPESVDGTLLDQADATLDADCGNYQIGHLIHHRAGGGNSFSGRAGGSIVCQGAAGRAASTGTNVNSGLWVVDLLPHEIGHQFSAAHTYNSTAGGCVERSAGNAYEIGSGTTIMSYACAGCTGEDANGNGCADAYFHTHSFDQITNYREAGGNCGTQTATGNTAPGVSAGADRTIPRGTPFTLTATGSDPDGDALTWCWEQYDLGAASPPLGGTGPLFRSFLPITGTSRTFPNMTDLLAGNPTPFEILPTTDRTLTFRATARDNRAGGGGVNHDTVVLTVAGDPFSLTYPNGGQSLNGGCTINVTWQVGGGNVAANVNILFSQDGGLTFPTTLASNVANDGAQEVVLPCVATTQTDARIRIEPTDNVFFDVSASDFTVSSVGPTASATAPAEVNVDAGCSVVIPVSGSVTDDCAIAAANVSVSATALGGTATVVPNINVVQNGDGRVDFSGTVTVSDLTGCPAVVRIEVTGEDGCGLEDSDIADVTVLDPVDPVVVTDATGGEVGATCTYLLPFSAVITDNCDLDPSDVVVTITNPSNNATVDTPDYQVAQPQDNRLEVTGTVLVSDLMSCPAVIRVEVGIADGCDNAASDTTEVEVVDVTPPQIAVELNRNSLWPPNHKLVDIVAEVTVTDNCPNPSFVLTSITSNEPENTLGDGDTSPDIVGASTGTADTAFQLRSERMGPGSGRVYTILYTASDNCGNTAQAAVEVHVGHDQKGGASVLALKSVAAGAPVDYLAVVVPAAPPVVEGEEELLTPVDRSAAVQPRPATPQGLLVGNTADVLAPTRLTSIDVDADGIRDAVALFPLAGVEAIRAASTAIDGPVGLHYENELGESFYMDDLLAVPRLGLESALGAMVSVAISEMEDEMPTGGPGPLETMGAGTLPEPASPEVVADAPAITRLAGFRPNPFLARTAVSFEMARPARVTVEVYATTGARVRALADLEYAAGRHAVTWDGRDDAGVRVAPGVYFVRFAADGVVQTGKALLLP